MSQNRIPASQLLEGDRIQDAYGLRKTISSVTVKGDQVRLVVNPDYPPATSYVTTLDATHMVRLI